MTDHHDHGHDHGHGGAMGVHGMVLFGDDVLYLSHLPMFGAPHNFQVVLEIALDDDVRSRVLSHDHVVPSENYDTFVPDAFPMAELDPQGDGPARTAITGKIVCGHFEREGSKHPPLAGKVTARIRRVVHFSELDLATKPSGRNLTYLCFGQGGRLYLAHEITTRPSFDHLLTVRPVPDTATDQAGRPLPDDAATLEKFFAEAFAVATPVQFEKSDESSHRLSSGESAAGLFFQMTPPSGFHGFRLQLETERELYLEIDELA